MTQTRKRPGLTTRPAVRELRSAGGREKAVAVAGLLVALGAALVALLWGQRSGALSASVEPGGPLTVPALSFLWGLAVMGLGTLLLFLGWPLYRLAVILTGLSIGSSVAGGIGWLVGGQTSCLIAAALGGAVGALVAWPTEILIRTLSGAVAGMALGLALGSQIGGGPVLILAALGGLLLGGALLFLFYKPLVMAYMAIIGSLLTVYGGLSAAHCLAGRVEIKPLYLGLAAALTVLGMFVQHSLGKRTEKTEE